MSMNHLNQPPGMCFSVNTTHSLFNLKHIPPENISIPSIREENSLRSSYHLFSSADIYVVPAVCMPPDAPMDNSKLLIMSFKSKITGVLAESISSDHCSRLDVLRIPIQIISNSFIRESTGFFLSWSILITMAVLFWNSDSITDISERDLYFILFMPSFCWISKEVPCLEIYFSVLMPSHIFPTWSSLPLSLPPLSITPFIFNTYPIKLSWSSWSIIISSWSQWFQVLIHAKVPSPLINYMSSGEIYMDRNLQLAIL